MNKIVVVLLFFISFGGYAQNISFEYDDAGNQIKRTYCSLCNFKSNETPKDIEDLKEEDLQKFFPNDVISYYPNPVKEQLYVKWENKEGVVVSEISIYNINGIFVDRIQKLGSQNTYVFSFGNLPQGVYILNLVYSNGEEKSIKIIKN